MRVKVSLNKVTTTPVKTPKSTPVSLVKFDKYLPECFFVI